MFQWPTELRASGKRTSSRGEPEFRGFIEEGATMAKAKPNILVIWVEELDGQTLRRAAIEGALAC
jgi:hypothetical protein